MQIQLLLTGNELMTGDTIDSNSAMIAQFLRQLGANVSRKTTVGDDLDLLIRDLTTLSSVCNVLIVNGGLGPTVDDLTAEAVGKACNCSLKEHPDALAHLEQWCSTRGIALNAANRKQALLPEGATIIPNPRGSAVGFRLEHQGCLIVCTPGVPAELRAMLSETILPLLRTLIGDAPGTIIHRLHTFGIGESSLQQWITDAFLHPWPQEVELGFRVGAPTLEVKLQSLETNKDVLEETKQRLVALIGDYIVAEGEGNLAATVIEELRRRRLTLVTAESCTGGLIASMITEQPGASSVFDSGFVTYANHSKVSLLGVDPRTLETHGAVSSEVVVEMVTGALHHSGADYGIAVSGVAGPEGGTPEKPTGTVWIAWGSLDRIESAELYLPFGRKMFQTYVAGMALDLIRRRVQGIEARPRYLDDRRRK